MQSPFIQQTRPYLSQVRQPVQRPAYQPAQQAYTQLTHRQAPAQDGFVRFNPSKGGLRFGACVNRGTAAKQAIDLIMRGSLQQRLHYVAEMGRAGTKELADVLTDVLLGQKGFLKVIKDSDPNDKLKQVTIISLLEAYEKGELSEEDKKKILEALKKASKKGYMRKVKGLIHYAIKKMQGEHVHQTEEVKQAIHEHQHAAGDDHHHHDGHHHHH